MKPNENKNPWQTQSSKTVYENNWLEVIHNEVLNPKGNAGVYGVVHFKNIAIGILPLDEDNNTWIVGQYRYPLKHYSWEMPEGGGKMGVDPLVSAKRELLEECGIIANNWEPLVTLHLSNSATDEYALIYVARELTFTQSEPEETEELHLKKVPFDTLYHMVMTGEVTDAMTVAAVLKLKLLMERESEDSNTIDNH